MKKAIIILLFIFVGAYIFLCSAKIVMAVSTKSRLESLAIKFSPLTASISKNTGNKVLFSGKNILFLGNPGEPNLPYQKMSVLLPPETDLNSVKIGITGLKTKTLSGAYNIDPVKPFFSLSQEESYELWPKDKTIVDGKDIAIYNNKALFPKNYINNLQIGEMRKWKIATFFIPLFRYNPSGKIVYQIDYSKAKLAVNYKKKTINLNDKEIKKLYNDNLFDNSVKDLVINFNQVSPLYNKVKSNFSGGSLASQEQHGYVIITTNDIVQNSEKLGDFIFHKENKGFNVYIATEDDWGGGVGDEATENIRNWLKNNYLDLNLEYVLLIGNPNPAEGDVPMKNVWPFRNFNISVGGDNANVGSDFFYADLTGNWDLDGDGKSGEAIGDFGVNFFGETGVDINYDVVVGRIPYYGIDGEIVKLDSILEKIINYQNETKEEAVWRKNVLLPMVEIGREIPSYDLGEFIKNSYIVPLGDWRYTRAYNMINFFSGQPIAGVQNLNPPVEITPVTINSIFNIWNRQNFGAVFWYTHGNQFLARNVVDNQRVLNLRNDHPSFVFQGSCLNAFPDSDNNLATNLLRNGAISVVGATAEAEGRFNIQNYYNEEEGGAEGVAVGYAKRLFLGKEESGYAMYNTKQRIVDDWINLAVFNLYGDPETGLFSFGESSPNMNVRENNLMIEDEAVVDFGAVSINNTVSKTFIIENKGNENLVLNLPIQIQPGNVDFRFVNPAVNLLGSGQTTTFVVSFTPSSVGEKSARLLINNNDIIKSPYIINLTGSGSQAQNIQRQNIKVWQGNREIRNREGFIFGDAPVGGSKSAVFSIENTGSAPLNVNEMNIYEHQNFSYRSNFNSPSVLPGQKVDFEISFTPVGRINYQTTFDIRSNDPDTPIYSFDISGTGEDWVTNINTNNNDFDNSQSNSIFNINFEGLSNNYPIVWYKLGSQPSSSRDGNFVNSQSLQVSTVVPCRQTLYLWPEDRQGNIYVGAIKTIELYYDEEKFYPIDISANGSNPSIPSNNPEFVIDWYNADFTNHQISRYWYSVGRRPNGPNDGLVAQSKPFTVTLNNYGRTPVYVWFEDVNGQINYEQAAEVILNYVDSRPVIEVKDANQVLLNNGDSYNFGSTVAGITVTKTFTIENKGTSDLILYSQNSLSPVYLQSNQRADFTVSSVVNRTTIRPGGSFLVTTNFRPRTRGEQRVTLNIQSNDSNQSFYSINLSGIGLAF